MALGATRVACLLLDLHARYVVVSSASEPLPPLSYNFTDVEMVELLAQAAGIFVEGGETFYLLRGLRRGLDLVDWAGAPPVSFGDLVAARVKSRTLAYIGVSAGSIVAGENTSIANMWAWSNAGILDGDFTGLQLAKDCVFLPHFKKKQEHMLEEYHTSLSSSCPWCRIVTIPQCQPVVSGLASMHPPHPQEMDYVCPGS